MINQKGGLVQSAEELMAKAKQDIAAPADYNKMLSQLKAFVALTEILFGDKSIATIKLGKLVHLIKGNNIIYKARVALDDWFPSKVLWSVCVRFQLFLESCTMAVDREDVDNTLINFKDDHRDIILGRFGGMLPPCFREVEAKEEDATTAKGNRTNKRKKDDTKDRRKEQKEGNPNLAVKNEHQCIDFKLREGKHWRTFAGSNLK
jgi:hypothetical protein